MEISLQRNSGRGGLPVYRQIVRHIRQEVQAGRLAAGSRLPPIRDLAAILGVSRDTVSAAYETLVSEGVVETGVGRGTFVREGLLPDRLDRVPWTPVLSSAVERLFALDRARPRFPAGEDTVPLHALAPDPALFPVESFRRAFNRALTEGGSELFSYAVPQGHRRLREVMARRFHDSGLEISADELVLCHGASQGISLAVRLFAQRGDAVAVEEPTYQNVLATLSALGLRTVPVPMRDDGPDLEMLARALERPEVKLFYSIPTFHNPLGITSSLENRRGLLAISARFSKPVIEDAYEMDLRYEGRGAPTLASLDRSGRVVQLFSYSKSLFPGLRVGSIAARGRAVEGLIALKRATDLADALPLQAALAEFLEAGAYDRHLVRVARHLRARREALLEALDEEMPEGVRWTKPEGGYQVWVEMPEGIDTRELLADAQRAGVLFAPGYLFNHDGRPSCGLRLTISLPDVEAIRRGVRLLAAVTREHLEKPAGAGSAAETPI